MKIIAGFEPTNGDTGEVSYKIIEEVVATTSPGELVACLEKWMPIKFETLVSDDSLCCIEFFCD